MMFDFGRGVAEVRANANCRDKMKDGFQRLLEIPLDIDDDEEKYQAQSVSPLNYHSLPIRRISALETDPQEQLLVDAIKNDSLRAWERGEV